MTSRLGPTAELRTTDVQPATDPRPLSLHVLAALLALIPALAGTKRGLIIPGFRISEIIVMVLLVFAVFNYNKKLWIGGRPFISLAVYSAATMLIVAYHVSSRGEVGFEGFLDSALGPATFLMLYIVALVYGANKQLMLLVLKYTFVCAAIMGLVGILQAIRFPAALNIAVQLTGNIFIAEPLDWKVPRSVGIYNSWHAFSSYMAVALVLLVGCSARGVEVFKRRFIQLLAASGVLGGLLSSLTFGMILLGLVISSIFLWQARKRLWICAIAVIAYAVTTISPLSQAALQRLRMQEATSVDNYGFLPQTIAFRIDVWASDYFPLISTNPIFGYGPITELDRTFSYVESMYILVLLSGGAFTLSLFVWFIWSAISSVSPSTRSDKSPEHRLVGTAVFYFLIGLIPLMFIHPYLNDAGSSQLVFLLLGLYCSRTTPSVNSGFGGKSENWNG